MSIFTNISKRACQAIYVRSVQCTQTIANGTGTGGLMTNRVVEHSKCNIFHSVNIVLNGVAEVLYCLVMLSILTIREEEDTLNWLVVVIKNGERLNYDI